MDISTKDEQEIRTRADEKEGPESRERIQTKFLSKKVDPHNSVVVTHSARLRYYYERWCTRLPRVQAYYAVKTLDPPEILSFLHGIGCRFDVASINEAEACLEIGATGQDMVVSHLHKTVKQIETYKRLGIRLLTVDSMEELLKMFETFPESDILVRVRGSYTLTPSCNPNEKFGTTIEEAKTILNEGASLGANIAGISFHLDADADDASCHGQTMSELRELFDYSEQELGRKMSILNIGGGFPGGHVRDKFDEMARNIERALEARFPVRGGVEIIAEPGRYFADPSTDIYACVIGKRKFQLADFLPRNAQETIAAADKKGELYGFHYILNDGVYGSLSVCRDNRGFDHWTVVGETTHPYYPSVLWGPTCDPRDKLTDLAEIPELEIGTWLVRKHSGAHCMPFRTRFNRIPEPIHEVLPEDPEN